MRIRLIKSGWRGARRCLRMCLRTSQLPSLAFPFALNTFRILRRMRKIPLQHATFEGHSTQQLTIAFPLPAWHAS